MNLYNELLGENPLADKILALIDVGRADFGRYRDVYLKDGGTKITVHTRIGGDNREYYEEQLETLGRHPLFFSCYDDDFDNTYAYVVFSVGEGMLPQAAKLYKLQGGEPESIQEKFEAIYKEMAGLRTEQMKADPRFRRTAEMLEKQIKAGDGLVRLYDDDMPKGLQL